MTRVHRRGFTLLELVIVIVVLGVLALLAIPTFSAVVTRTKDASTAATIASVLREASVLAAFRGETTFILDDIEAAVADLPAAAPGVQAAEPAGQTSTWSINLDAQGASLAPGVISAGLGGSPGGSLAGLASRSPSGHCAFAVSSGVGSGVQSWVVAVDLGAGCSAAAALDGPPGGLAPSSEEPATTTTTTTPTTTTTTVAPLELSYSNSTFNRSASLESLLASTSGGVGPYSFEVTAGTVPAGVTFNPSSGTFTGPAAWPDDMVQVDAGGLHSCGIDAAGAAWCWGELRRSAG